MGAIRGWGRSVNERLSRIEGRWRAGIAVSLIVLTALVGIVQAVPFVMAGGGGCHQNDSSHNVTSTTCADFTTSSWNTGYGDVEYDQTACYTAVAAHDGANGWTSNGSLQVTEYDRADMSSSCTTNQATLLIDVGLHSATFNTWGSTSEYIVLANFTFSFASQSGTYCAGAGAPTSSTYVETTVAMYDDTTGMAAGYSVPAGESIERTASTVCGTPGSNDPSGVSAFACYVTGAYPSGHTMIPRASIFANVTSSAPYSSLYGANHAYAQIDSSGDGSGIVTLDSIWVSQGTTCGAY